MSDKPVKRCDYCEHVGAAYTSTEGETTCQKCLADLGVNSRAIKLRVRKLEREILKLREQNDALKSNLEEISEADCLGEVAKILRNCGFG